MKTRRRVRCDTDISGVFGNEMHKKSMFSDLEGTLVTVVISDLQVMKQVEEDDLDSSDIEMPDRPAVLYKPRLKRALLRC